MNEEEIIQKLWNIAITSTFETKDYPSRVVMKDDLLTLLKAYEQEKEKNKKLEEERLTGIQVKCMQDEAYIKARADFERDYMNGELTDMYSDITRLSKENKILNVVIDMMAEDIYNTPDDWLCKTMKIKEDCYADTIEDNSACKECIKQHYFKKARGEENETKGMP